MLFKFNNIWKFVCILLGSWAIYGFLGYDFAVVTLLGSILALKAIQETVVI